MMRYVIALLLFISAVWGMKNNTSLSEKKLNIKKLLRRAGIVCALFICIPLVLGMLAQRKEENLTQKEGIFRELSHNQDFIKQCSDQIKKDAEASFKIIGSVEVSKVFEYKENTSMIEGKFIEKFTTNPIRNIYHTNTYSCQQDKKNTKIKIQILDIQSKTAPCSDGTNPPIGMRCK